MKPPPRGLIVAILLPLIWAPALAGDRERRLAAGEILSSTRSVEGIERARAEAIIDAPPALVWDNITDYTHYKDFMPRTRASEVLKQEGNIVIFRTTLGFLIKRIRYTIRIVHNQPAGAIDWSLVKGDLTRNDGSWRLTPVDEGRRTLAVYELAVVTGFRVPASIESFLTKRSLPGVIRALRKRISAKAK